jgi:ribose transport system substrate-binding protein
MRSKRVFIIVTAMFFVLAFVSTGLAQQEKWVVFSVKNIVNPFWKACWVGAQKAAAEVKGIKLTYTSPTKADNIDEQTRMMEDIILQRPQGIVFVPVDYVALVPTVEKMNKANIPVFNYCNEMAGGKYHIYVGCDDETLAYEIAKYAFKAVGNKGKVILQDGVPGAITAQNRKKGFNRAIKDTPGMELLTTQPANYNRLMAMQVMENLLQRYSKIDVVLAANDEQALGCIEAIDAAGRLKEIKVTWVDSNYDAANSIMAGRQFASADYSGHDQGYLATKAAIKFLNGEKIPKKIILPVVIVTKDIAKKWTVPFEQRPVPNYDEIVKKNAVW